jgi:MoaA/NifB/PqqE/SkfB family radical SAM enzyme
MKNNTMDYDSQYTLIELTNHCNYRCPMCPQAIKNGMGKKGFMTFETFKNIIDSLPRKTKPNAVKPFWLGEPMLHPEFNKFLSYAAEKFSNPIGKEYIVFDTNGSRMDKSVSEVLLKYGNVMPLFTVSLDAINEKTYEKIRIGGNFKQVMENINYFLKKRYELKKISPKIVLQFILMRQNADEVLEFIEYWKALLKRYYVPGNDYHKDVIWIKRRDDPNAEKQEKWDKFFLEEIKKQNLSSQDLGYAKIEVVLANDWNEK